jgi:succinate dehydrogenase / fumarate reductase, cytochrome b subunit
VMDTGAGFELGINKTFAILTIVGSILLTAALWVYLLGVVK